MRKFVSRVNSIISDNQSGSLHLINDLIDACKEFLQDNIENDISIINGIIVDQLLSVANKHIQQVALYKLINDILLVLENNSDSRLKILDFLSDYKNNSEEYLNKISDNILSMLNLEGKNILLHSSSSSIQFFLKRLADDKNYITIYQTVSHPASEGIKQAKYIAELGHKVILIEDSAVGKIISKIDLVLLGADAVLGDTFINKIGTSFLCHASYKSKLPVFVVADTRKYIPNSENTYLFVNSLLNEAPKNELEIFDSTEVENISVENYYYEEIPSKLVSVYINEQGVFTTKRIRDFVDSIEISSQLFKLQN